MKTEIYWVPTETPGKLAVMPRPRGGDWLEDEVRAWRSMGIDVVVSMLTTSEVTELDLAREEMLCKENGIVFRALPTADRSVPASKEAVRKLIAELANGLDLGKTIAIHCRQALGRAPLVAIVLLVLTGLDADKATAQVSRARGTLVPETIEQQRWIADFVKALPVSTAK